MIAMRYLISVIDDQTGTATGTEQADIDVFNDKLRAKGHWVFADGLAAPAAATVIDSRDGKGLVTDGPFLEAKAYVAGLLDHRGA
jgi:hypothetical protein